MLEIFWLTLASIPFVTGLAFVLAVYKQRSHQTPERVRARR